MRKWFKSHLITILCAVIAFLSMTTMALGATVIEYIERSISCHVVIQLVGDMKIYAEPECITEIRSIDFHKLKRGATSLPITVYVKNTGEANFTQINISNIFPESLTINKDVNDFGLAIGAVQPVTLTLTASTTALGTYDFGIIFKGTYSYG